MCLNKEKKIPFKTKDNKIKHYISHVLGLDSEIIRVSKN